MAKKNLPFRTRLLRGLAAALSLVLLVYFASVIVGDVRAIRAQQRELEALNIQIRRQQAINDELTRLIKSGTLEEQLERVAREKLGYIRPDERIYIDSPD